MVALLKKIKKILRLEIIYNDMEYACTNEYPKSNYVFIIPNE